MATIRETIFSNWHFMRYLRLGAGIFIAVQAILLHEPVFGLIALFFLFQAISNTGCCGSQSCAVQKKTTGTTKETTFEEIK